VLHRQIELAQSASNAEGKWDPGTKNNNINNDAYASIQSNQRPKNVLSLGGKVLHNAIHQTLRTILQVSANAA